MWRDWIQTLSGKKLNPRFLEQEMVGSIEEIAHALAGEFRFTRQTQRRYTVAEHCTRGSRLIAPEYAGAFLLHELSEVYLPDIASPLKPYLCVDLGDDFISWSALERHHTGVILDALELSHLEPLIYSDTVKQMDLAMLGAEKRCLLGPEPESWGLEFPPLPIQITPWSPDHAANEFLFRFHELFPRGEP